MNEIKKSFIVFQLDGKCYKISGENIQLDVDYIEKLSIKNNLHIEIAIRRAYEDSQQRLMKGHNNIAGKLWDKDNGPLAYLREEIHSYFMNFKNNKMGFDECHKMLCSDDGERGFLYRYNKLVSGICGKQAPGKAQKIINMTLKYISCYQDVEDEWFKDCHMVLDHYTLDNWFCSKIKRKGKPSKESIGSWSKLEYGDELNIGSYMWIQSEIRKWFKEKNEMNGYYYLESEKRMMTPFEAEFLIWEEEKIIEALKGIKNYEFLSHTVIYSHNAIGDDVEKAINNLYEIKRRYVSKDNIL